MPPTQCKHSINITINHYLLRDDLESENEEEDTERPMSRNAVKEKAMRRLIKREQQIQQESVNSGLPAASLSTAKAQGQKQHRRKASKRQE